MGVWGRSWAITRASFGVIGKDKEMLWFPVLSGFFSLLFAAALLVPSFVLQVVEKTGHGHLVVGPLQWVTLFVTYFGLSFIATFFNVCVVNTTRVRLSGGDATFLDSIKFAFSRVHLILGWSLVAATVGILLRCLDSIAERSGLAGRILLGILRAVLASAWSILTIFVVPVMVYKGLGPFDAIRESVGTLKKTWGESLVRHYGLGLAAFVCLLPCVLLVMLGFGTAAAVPFLGGALIGLGAVAFLAVALVFSVASSVFNTILYHYATSGAAEGIDATLLSAAFTQRSR
jgi:membrane-anchored glycerophosphoryl diester phosphodiesterase (GDPDase)